MRLETKSLLLGIFAIFLISLGLYVFVNALTAKNEGADAFRWGLLGTYSLVLINLGLFCFGQAVRFRLLIDISQKMKRTERKVVRKIKSRYSKNKNVSE
ncbi:MAG: hypothetical protein V4683_03785 [Bacteroidota bacterium]